MNPYHFIFSILRGIALLSAHGISAGEIERFDTPLQPTFSLADFDGERHTLPDYQGKVVLVNFWATWCLPCIYEMPELMQLRQQFADKPFEIVAINVAEKNTGYKNSPRRRA